MKKGFRLKQSIIIRYRSSKSYMFGGIDITHENYLAFSDRPTLLHEFDKVCENMVEDKTRRLF